MGSLPSVGHSNKSVTTREASSATRRMCVRYRNATLATTSETLLHFLQPSYTLTISARVEEQPVVYTFVKPIGSYFTEDGVLCRNVIESDAGAIMEVFRQKLHEVGDKKQN